MTSIVHSAEMNVVRARRLLHVMDGVSLIHTSVRHIVYLSSNHTDLNTLVTNCCPS